MVVEGHGIREVKRLPKDPSILCNLVHVQNWKVYSCILDRFCLGKERTILDKGSRLNSPVYSTPMGGTEINHRTAFRNGRLYTGLLNLGRNSAKSV